MMSVIFIVILVFIGYALLFFLKKEKKRVGLIIFFICSILTLFSILVYGFSNHEAVSYLPIGVFFSYLNGPFMLLLTNGEKQRRKTYFIYGGLAFVVPSIVLLICYYFYVDYSVEFEYVAVLISVFICIGFGSYGYLNYFNQKQRTKDQELTILFYVVLLFLFAFFVSMTVLKGTAYFFHGNLLFLWNNLGMLAFALVYEGIDFYLQVRQKQPVQANILHWNYFKQTNVMFTKSFTFAANAQIKNRNKKKSSDPNIASLDPTVLKQVLFAKIIAPELFLDHNLTLNKVAELTQTDKRKLNHYFKNSESSSFKQYINRLKVEYAINLIREREKDITVEELTFICGFNTRLSFYRAFVYFYGFAPSELLSD